MKLIRALFCIVVVIGLLLTHAVPSYAATCAPGYITVTNTSGSEYFHIGDTVTIGVHGEKISDLVLGSYALRVYDVMGNQDIFQMIAADNVLGRGIVLRDQNVTIDSLEGGNYQISLTGTDSNNHICDPLFFYICAGEEDQEHCKNTLPTDSTIPEFDYCKQVPPLQQQACVKCVGQGPEISGNLYTAVGCVRVDEQGLAADLIRLLLGVAGGVALLSILAGAFIFTTSQGESNRVKQAKELITAAVSGLLFIIFVVIILDFIGVRILQIPGLG